MPHAPRAECSRSFTQAGGPAELSTPTQCSLARSGAMQPEDSRSNRRAVVTSALGGGTGGGSGGGGGGDVGGIEGGALLPVGVAQAFLESTVWDYVFYRYEYVACRA